MAAGMSFFNVPCGSQPSPRSAARRMAAFDDPPIQMGGPPGLDRAGPLPEVARAPLVGERGANRVDRFVGELAAVGERDAEQVELRLDMAGADAEDRATVAERVERRERLRGLQRMAVRGNVHVAQQADVGRERGEPAECRDGVVPRRVHRLRVGSWDGDVIAHGDVVEAVLVARACDGGELARAGVLLPVLDEVRALRLDRELHPVRVSSLIG